MLQRIGPELRRAGVRVIRVLDEALSIAIIVGMSLVPAAAAIAVGSLFARGSIPVAVLASAGLGVTVAFGIGLVRSRRRQRSRRKHSSHDCAEEPKASDSSPAELTNAMVTFHDFDPERRRFDHW